MLVGSALILALSLGIRHGFGLFLSPMRAQFGWGREVFAFAIALQNLLWGLAQPFAAALNWPVRERPVARLQAQGVAL